jgi:hypothetical protein
MIARGVVHANAADMAAFYPDLFPSHDAARAAIKRWGGGTAETTWRLVAQLPEPWSLVRWQRRGQGQKLRGSLVPAAAIEELRRTLVAEYGELAAWWVEAFTAGRRSAKSPEECDIPGNQEYLGMSHSFPAVAALTVRATVPPPRGPPAG